MSGFYRGQGENRFRALCPELRPFTQAQGEVWSFKYTLSRIEVIHSNTMRSIEFQVPLCLELSSFIQTQREVLSFMHPLSK